MEDNEKSFLNATKDEILTRFMPKALGGMDRSQAAFPLLARNVRLLKSIENILPRLPTYHDFYRTDATAISFLEPESIHLVITSPPYWILKKYNEHERQLGSIENYDLFIANLDKVWEHCYQALVPGGRLICVVGDVCLSRRKNNGCHTVVPLHATIQEQCRKMGYANVAPIIWHKIANAKLEASGNATFLGKPYEPNAIIKNDIEFILMERKPGGYRSPSFLERAFSVISVKHHKIWFNQIWTGVTGASTRNHPAPYPLELAQRLIRMFSFVGDIVLDPFLGSGTTAIAAYNSGRNSINVEIDEAYFQRAVARFKRETSCAASNHIIHINT